MGHSIKDYSKEIKGGTGAFFKEGFRREEAVIAGLMLVSAFGGFALGRVSEGRGIPPVGIYGAYPATNAPLEPQNGLGETNLAQNTRISTFGGNTGAGDTSLGGELVASKAGTKYHLPWCPGAQSMREENKIFFATKEDAERAGYTPALNCKGL